MTKHLYLTMLLMLLAARPGAGATLTFDDLEDSTSVGATYSSLGVTFSNATVLTAGVSLNEFDFPPLSGDNVVFDFGGPMLLFFDPGVVSFEAFFTYTTPLTLRAYNAAGLLLASPVSSLYADNTTSWMGSAEYANERLSIVSTVEDFIAKIEITGSSTGSSFTMDSVSFETSKPVAVPEPGVDWACYACIALLLVLRATRLL